MKTPLGMPRLVPINPKAVNVHEHLLGPDTYETQRMSKQAAKRKYVLCLSIIEAIQGNGLYL